MSKFTLAGLVVVGLAATGAAVLLLGRDGAPQQAPPRGGGEETTPEQGVPQEEAQGNMKMTKVEPQRVQAVGLDHEAAVAVARTALAALEGKLKVPSNASIEVRRANAKNVTTFKITLPPGVRGGDYAAKVTTDAKTGQILEILAGS